MSSTLGGLLPDTTVLIAWGETRDSDLGAVTWVDITDDLEADSGVTLRRGKADEDSEPDATVIEILLDNRDGNYTPDHQPGLNWPDVVRGVPLRVVQNWGVNLCGNPSFEVNNTGWAPYLGGPVTIARTTTTAYPGIDGGAGAGLATSTSSADAAVSYTISGLTVGVTYCVSVYVYLPTAGGVAQVDVAWPFVAGTTQMYNSVKDEWVRIYAYVTATATTHTFAITGDFSAASQFFYVDGAQVEVGTAPSLYTGIAPTDFTVATGFVDDWTPAWPGKGEEYSVVRVTASGRLRAAATADPMPSVVGCALTRDSEVLNGANVTHYYPMNEEAGSGELRDASGLGDRPAIPVLWSQATTGTGTLPAGFESQPVPNVITARANGTLAGHTVAGAGTIGSGSGFAVWFRTDEGLPTGATAVQVGIIAMSDANGNAHYFYASSDVVFASNALTNLNANPISGPNEYAIYDTSLPFADGAWHFMVATFEQTGASTVTVTLWVDGVNLGTDLWDGSPTTVPPFTSVRLAPDYGNIMNLAHFTVWDSPDVDPSLLLVANAGSSFVPVADRVDELARWGFNLPTVDHVGTTTTYVAGQAILGQSPLEVIRTAARSDNGLIYESQDGDLAFVTGNSRYDLSPVLTLDGDDGQIEDMDPVNDDRRIVNVATVTGPYTVGIAQNRQSIAAYGKFNADREVATAGTLSVSRFSGDSVQRYAEWLANTRAEVVEGRSAPEVRFPTVTIDLGNCPELIEEWLTGDPLYKMIRLSNPPSQLLGPRDAIIEGYEQSTDGRSYRVSLTCSPYIPTWTVEDATTGAVAPLGNTLSVGINAAVTSMTVAYPAGTPAWIQTGPFPDLDLEGECVGVSAIGAPSSNTQVFTIVRGKNGTTAKSHGTGAVVTLWSKHVVAL